MVLNKRERYIAIVTVSVILLLVIDQVLYTPYSTRLTRVQAQTIAVKSEIERGQNLLKDQAKLQSDWSEIQNGGLKKDASQAESQLQHEMLNAAQAAGVMVVGTKPERSSSDKTFQVLSFSASGNGTMGAISRLLYTIERSKIPLRLNEVQITPRREGSDELSVRLSVSTLRLLPEEKKK